MSTVNTVLGEIKDSDLGLTLPHEHLFIDLGNGPFIFKVS